MTATGIIPDHWRKYKVPKDISLNIWVADLNTRLQQLENIAKTTDYSSINIWFGGLFIPEAYTTATRQAVAQRMQWSLEELALEVDIGRSGEEGAFTISGLRLEGGKWDNNELALTPEPTTKLTSTQIRWVRKSDFLPGSKAENVNLPVYLTSDRSDLLFTISVPVRKEERGKISQRALAVVTSF